MCERSEPQSYPVVGQARCVCILLLYKEISFFESDYCENNLRYEGVREDLENCIISVIILNLRLFFYTLPGFSQQFSLCAWVRFQILCEWHSTMIIRDWKAAPTRISI